MELSADLIGYKYLNQRDLHLFWELRESWSEIEYHVALRESHWHCPLCGSHAMYPDNDLISEREM